jgi:cytochrome c peroxidase
MRVESSALCPIPVAAAPLGLPPVPVPEDNPMSEEKIKLGDKLYHDKRLSHTGEVSCATCHDETKAFTDNLRVSKGINDLTVTRNAPTVINAAYMRTQFWDGREPDLEGQSKQLPVNPVEMGMPNHDAVVEKVRADADYVQAFKSVFGVSKDKISMDHVAKAIATFQRTVVAGDSAFDKWFYGGEDTMSEQQIRGYELYIGKGRCVSCHVIEQTQALFTDNRFHNIGIGLKKIKGKEAETAVAFPARKKGGADVDVTVLTDPNMSELGRFGVTENPTEVGSFKTANLRNVTSTQP